MQIGDILAVSAFETEEKKDANDNDGNWIHWWNDKPISDLKRHMETIYDY